jgi:hypothetical protein
MSFQWKTAAEDCTPTTALARLPETRFARLRRGDSWEAKKGSTKVATKDLETELVPLTLLQLSQRAAQGLELLFVGGLLTFG